MNGAEALKRALSATPSPSRKSAPKESAEDRIVNEAFRLLEAPIKGWIRSRVRAGSSLVESVAKLSAMLEAGQSILNAAGGVARAVQSVARATDRKR